MKKPTRSTAVAMCLAVMAAALLCACQMEKPAPAPVQMTPADTVQNVRPHFPDGTVMGAVIAVDTSYNLAAVGSIPVAGIHKDDIFSFVDGKGEPFNYGQVIKVLTKGNDGALEDAVHVRYGTGRAPQKGDVAVLVPPHVPVATQPSN